MAQRLYEVSDLPEGGIAASAEFYSQHMNAAQAALDGFDALAILLPPAGSDHADWRCAVARDLARAHAPARVNVVSGPVGKERETLLNYLSDAKAVTGHYLEVRD